MDFLDPDDFIYPALKARTSQTSTSGISSLSGLALRLLSFDIVYENIFFIEFELHVNFNGMIINNSHYTGGFLTEKASFNVINVKISFLDNYKHHLANCFVDSQDIILKTKIDFLRSESYTIGQ